MVSDWCAPLSLITWFVFALKRKQKFHSCKVAYSTAQKRSEQRPQFVMHRQGKPRKEASKDHRSHAQTGEARYICARRLVVLWGSLVFLAGAHAVVCYPFGPEVSSRVFEANKKKLLPRPYSRQSVTHGIHHPDHILDRALLMVFTTIWGGSLSDSSDFGSA